MLAGDLRLRCLALHGGKQPVLHGACVEHGLGGGKGLADHDHQRLLWVEPVRREHRERFEKLQHAMHSCPNEMKKIKYQV